MPRVLARVALVDADSRVGKTGLVFYGTSLDWNASSHIALERGRGAWVRDLSPEERSDRGVNHPSSRS